tara:strand:+ start:271 stop:942 length:672 start_codon:yes stop_codon:yes gene_type:complete
MHFSKKSKKVFTMEKSNDANSESIVVFTHKSREFLLKLNATCSWVINPHRAKKCKYVVCTRNALHELADDQYLHGHGVIIGRNLKVSPSKNKIDKDRYMIEFNEYAELSDFCPAAEDDLWGEVTGPSKSKRMPVRYIDTYWLTNIILREGFDDLVWKPVPKRDEEYVQAQYDVENKYNHPDYEIQPRNIGTINSFSESIDRAKKDLSKELGVTEENIEIIIKG